MQWAEEQAAGAAGSAARRGATGRTARLGGACPAKALSLAYQNCLQNTVSNNLVPSCILVK